MQIKQKFLTAAFLGAVLAGLSTPSFALFGDDEARKAILELREKAQTMQNAQMQLVREIEMLRSQNAELTGRVEKLTNDLAQQQKSVRDLFGNLDKRTAAFESQLESVDGKSITVTPEERRRYDLALQLFSDGSYAQSHKILEGLIDDYPKTGYMPAALYWLGNAMFAQGQFTDAVEVQKRLIAAFPQDARIPEAKLSLAAALVNLGKKKEATETLKGVQKDYPDTEAAKLAGERLKALTAKPDPGGNEIRSAIGRVSPQLSLRVQQAPGDKITFAEPHVRREWARAQTSDTPHCLKRTFYDDKSGKSAPRCCRFAQPVA